MKTPSVLIFLLCSVNGLALSQEKVWRISWFDVGSNQYTSSTGKLKSLQGDSLVMTEDSSELWIPVGSLKEMRYDKGSSRGLAGAVIGAGLGAGLGYVVGTLVESNTIPTFLGGQNESTKPTAIVVGGLVGCGIGAAIGSSSSSKKYDFSSMAPDKKLSTLSTILTAENKQIVRQSYPIDVVYLKDGTIIKGEVLEVVPDSIVRMKTTYGGTAVFEMASVQRIGKDSTYSRMPHQTTAANEDTPLPVANQEKKGVFIPFAGAAIPLGAFGEKSGATAGAAKLGFTFGGDMVVHLGPSARWLTSGILAFNSFDVSVPNEINADIGSWSSVLLLTGLRFDASTSSSTVLFSSFQGGVLIGGSPELTISSGSQSASLNSDTGVSFAVGVGAGMELDKVVMHVRYTYGKPEYKLSASNSSFTSKYSQPTSLLILTLGVRL